MEQTKRDQDLASVALLSDPARRRLYDWVVEQTEPVGRDAAAAALGISRSLAAFHLDRLAEAGLLDTTYRRLSGRTGPGAGRPARLYARAEREIGVSLPRRSYEQAAGLFAVALEKLADGGAPAPLRDVAGELGEKLGRSAEGRRGSNKRLLHVLQDAGYQPAADETGTIRLRNCPFDALVDAHQPLVCSTNLALCQGMIRGAGISAYEPVIDRQPGFCCVAFVRQPAVIA